VLGSPYESRIITRVRTFSWGIVDYRMNMQHQANAPRFSSAVAARHTDVEMGISPETVGLLDKMEHRVAIQPDGSGGERIAIGLASGEPLGASDFREHGKAVGY